MTVVIREALQLSRVVWFDITKCGDDDLVRIPLGREATQAHRSIVSLLLLLGALSNLDHV